MANIMHYLVIRATPDKVYRAITTQEGLANWWTKETTAKPEVEFINIFMFGGEYRNEMKVTKLISNKRVEWECINAHEEWIGTRVSFDLEEKEGKTILRFSHAGWKEATDFFADCNYNWGIYMKSLKTLCETGKGMPYN